MLIIWASLVVRNLPANVEDVVLIPGLRKKSPGEKNGKPTPVFFLHGESHGQKSVVGGGLQLLGSQKSWTQLSD